MSSLRKKAFVQEGDLLFPRKFDRSRFIFYYNVDVTLREVNFRLDGWGGYHGEHIACETGQGTLDGWAERFYYGTGSLWSQLELQCHPEDRCISRHRDCHGAG